MSTQLETVQHLKNAFYELIMGFQAKPKSQKKLDL